MWWMMDSFSSYYLFLLIFIILLYCNIKWRIFDLSGVFEFSCKVFALLCTCVHFFCALVQRWRTTQSSLCLGLRGEDSQHMFSQRMRWSRITTLLKVRIFLFVILCQLRVDTILQILHLVIKKKSWNKRWEGSFFCRCIFLMLSWPSNKKEKKNRCSYWDQSQLFLFSILFFNCHLASSCFYLTLFYSQGAFYYKP